MRQRLRLTTVVVLLFLGLFGAWLYELGRWSDSVVPAGDTLADHLAHRSPPYRARVFEVAGQEYVAVFGPWRVSPRFPSGPPVYVYDQQGRLVDWCGDTGDGGLNPKWNGAYQGREITPAELAQWPGEAR